MIPEDIEIKPHYKIRINKGAVIRSTHPQRAKRICERAFVVTTHKRSRAGSEVITWRGSGSYWFWADRTDCDLYSIS